MNNVSPLDRMIAGLARKETAGLLDDAVALARQRVRDDLAQRIAAAMTAELTATMDTPTGEQQATAPPATERGLYAYGIVRDGELDLHSANGIGEPARVVSRDGLGLVVSDIRLAELAGLDTEQPAENSRLAEFARRHDAVVRKVFDQGPILPLRFGTVLTDAAAAAELLGRQREQALMTLDRIAGKHEWGTKVVQTSDVDEPGDPVDARSGTEYLTRKRDELAARKAARERRRALLDRVHDTLAEHAAEHVRRPSVSDSVLLDSAFLVPDDGADAFIARADEVAHEIAGEGLSLRTTGPWPPYSFAVIEERTSA